MRAVDFFSLMSHIISCGLSIDFTSYLSIWPISCIYAELLFLFVVIGFYCYYFSQTYKIWQLIIIHLQVHSVQVHLNKNKCSLIQHSSNIYLTTVLGLLHYAARCYYYFVHHIDINDRMG